MPLHIRFERQRSYPALQPEWIHCITNGTIVVPHRVKEGMQEAQRMRVERGEGDMARQVADVKHYIGKLDEMEGTVKEHQTAESYLVILKDLKERRISTGLLLGELSGRQDTRIAEEQGRAEAWTTGLLAEIQQKDMIERRQEVEDLLTGVFIRGASVWFGSPRVRSAIVGAVSSFVVRNAQDDTSHS